VDAELREKFVSDLEQYRAENRSFEDVDQLYLNFRPRQAGNIYYRTYETRNGLITVGCLSNPPRKRMAEILGLRDIRFEEGYDARTTESRAFGEQLALRRAELMKEKTTEEWLEIFDRAGVPVSPVYYTEELVEHEQVAANENVVELEHSLLGPLTMYGPTLKMNETPLRAQRAALALGEHTDDILSGLGYTAEQIEALRRDEVTR
jgi:crotonobetainyl-CoA:carnitine CoA-transferase CaiB-like acyl-CoA transferase